MLVEKCLQWNCSNAHWNLWSPTISTRKSKLWEPVLPLGRDDWKLPSTGNLGGREVSIVLRI